MSTEANDTDGNGVITRQEFVDVSEQIFIALDRDNDGTLTLADFGR
jgi:Ca2+-binding EF-hand superfamily protein